MSEKLPTRSPQDADKYVVRFPGGMRDAIAEAAKANNRSMNAEIVARLSSELREPTNQEVAERRKLELVAAYVSWCEIYNLDPHKSFSKYATEYNKAAASGEDSDADHVSSIDEVDYKYLAELYATWLVERPHRYPSLVDNYSLANRPTQPAPALIEAIARLNEALAEREFNHHLDKACIDKMSEALRYAYRTIKNSPIMPTSLDCLDMIEQLVEIGGTSASDSEWQQAREEKFKNLRLAQERVVEVRKVNDPTPPKRRTKPER